jgi:hypothetical protein
MRFWWVNHKQTYRQEIGGGYIWSPKKRVASAGVVDFPVLAGV